MANQTERFRQRYERREAGLPSEERDEEDIRTLGQHDRDRVLYTTALRRLSGITQVTAGGGTIVHNRLTHSLEVAQIARRLAERLLEKQRPLSHQLGDIDPDVVEAAALAHDLGHPPFGHAGEEELKSLAVEHHVPGGFEGNAQSFRIITKLAVRRYNANPDDPQAPGLDLTRATLNAVLKYPWTWADVDRRRDKWGVYNSEMPVLQWAKRTPFVGGARSIEAEIMDWADDIAYSVHDLEDYFRAGKIPLERLFRRGSPAAEEFLSDTLGSESARKRLAGFDDGSLRSTFQWFEDTFPISSAYTGTRRDRGRLRALTSSLISRYISAAHLDRDPDEYGNHLRRGRSGERLEEMEVGLLKELTWRYVIEAPRLQRKQQAQRQMVRDVFDSYRSYVEVPETWDRFPAGYRERLEEIRADMGDAGVRRSRLVLVFIAGMTEQEIRSRHRSLHR